MTSSPQGAPSDFEAPFRVGVIGAGEFGRFCIGAYNASEHIHVVAVADPDDSSLEKVQGDAIRRFPNWQDVVADDSIEAIHLATPPFLRESIVEAAFSAGKSVFCEKPLALSLDGADRMIAAACRHGTVVSVNYVMRHHPAYRLLNALAQSGLFGAVRTLGFQNYAQRVPSSHWFWNRELSGGILVEHGVHFFDAYARLLGTPVRVWGDVPRPEAINVSVQYAEGPIARFYHEFAFTGAVERAVGLTGFERGYIEIEGWIPTRLTGAVVAQSSDVMDVGRTLGLNLHIHEGRALTFEIDFPDRQGWYRRGVVAGMSDVVRLHRDPQSSITVSAVDARNSLALALAAHQAAITGTHVTM